MPGPIQTLTVKEQDGSPSVSGVNTIKVSNGSLTDNGGGVVSITTGGGGGGITGSGTANTVAKFTGATAIGDSALTDNGTTLTYSGSGGISANGSGGGVVNMLEGSAPSGAANHDILYADSSAHRLKVNNNNGGAVNVAVAGDAATTFTMSTAKLLGRSTASTGAVEEITVGSGLTLSAGSLTASGGIGGSTGSTDNAILRADGTGGATVQSSGVTIDDSNNVSTPGTVTVTQTRNNANATDGLILANNQAASSGTTTISSPGLRLSGARWTGSASSQEDFLIFNQGGSGQRLYFYFQDGGGGYNGIAYINSTGSAAFGSTFISGGNDGYLQTAATLRLISGNGERFGLNNNGSVELASTLKLGWSSTSEITGQNPDTAFARNAAGVVEVNNGTAGTFRDVLVRTVRHTPLTIATLPTGVAGMTAYVTDGDASLAWGDTVVNSGAGATKYLVWYNGSSWSVVGK